MSGEKRKAEHPQHVPNKVKAERKFVMKFWQQNYRYGAENTLRKLKPDSVYNLCISCYPDLGISFHRFHELTRNAGVKVKRGSHGQVDWYYPDPLTDLANSYHGINKGERPLSLSLINIQGLITNDKNKTEVMRHIMKLDEPGKICMITETHLHKKTHLDSEIQKYLKNYHIIRGDRDREYDLEDDAQLLSHGGAMILTSPDSRIIS